jgi:transcriptional regulator with XRE-family HTH domain
MGESKRILLLARVGLELSASDIAERLSCTTPTVWRLERGEAVACQLMERVPAAYELSDEAAGRWLRLRGQRGIPDVALPEDHPPQFTPIEPGVPHE